MNAIRKMVKEIAGNAGLQTHLTLISNENQENKMEAEQMSKEYINEKLYYFYTNGGPVMDI